MTLPRLPAGVRWFGFASLVAAGVLLWFDKSAFVSLWCAWAAITSVAICVHLRHVNDARRQDHLVATTL